MSLRGFSKNLIVSLDRDPCAMSHQSQITFKTHN